METSQGLIGKQISFNSVSELPLFYLSHVMFSHIENNEVIVPPIPNPYAIITVQIKDKQEAILPVSHKIDFNHLYRLEQEGYLNNADYMIYIKYKPATGFRRSLRSFLPKLEYTVMEFDESNNLKEIIKAYDQEFNFI